MARFTEPRLYQFFIVVWSAKRAGFYRVKYWEIIADNLSKPVGVGVTCQPRIPRGEQSGLLTRIVGDGKRFVVRADEMLTAFVELEAAIRVRGDFVLTGWRNFSKLGVAKRI
jgi:hypothetical protein